MKDIKSTTWYESNSVRNYFPNLDGEFSTSKTQSVLSSDDTFKCGITIFERELPIQ